LETTGYKLSLDSGDALLLGTHLLLNYKLIEESHHKIENDGIAVEPLPKESDILSIVKRASSGDQDPLTQLKDSLTFLPVEGHFKVIKPEKFTEIQNLI
jgi:hypothetical protein